MQALNERVGDLERAQQQVVETERLAAIGQLSAGVAHEINNPVAYLLANTEFLLDSLTPLVRIAGTANEGDARQALWSWWQGLDMRAPASEMVRALEENREGIQRIRLIVADIHTLAQQSGASGAQVFDLNAAVRSAIRLAGAEIRGVAEVSTSLGDGVVVRGHPGQLSQVFFDLLTNAAKSFGRGTQRTRRINVSTQKEKGRVVAVIADTGTGVPDAEKSRLFQPLLSPGTSGEG